MAKKKEDQEESLEKQLWKSADKLSLSYLHKVNF